MSSAYAADHDSTPRWKRMDLVGVTVLMGALICFILSLTQGPIDGWKSVSFIAPFVLSFPLAFSFFLWGAWKQIRPRPCTDEQKLGYPPRALCCPVLCGKYPTSSSHLSSSSLRSLSGVSTDSSDESRLLTVATSQVQYSTYWQEVFGWSPIHVAVAMLPQGVAAVMAGSAAQAIPGIITKPRITISVGAVCA